MWLVADLSIPMRLFCGPLPARMRLVATAYARDVVADCHRVTGILQALVDAQWERVQLYEAARPTKGGRPREMAQECYAGSCSGVESGGTCPRRMPGHVTVGSGGSQESNLPGSAVTRPHTGFEGRTVHQPRKTHHRLA